MSSLRSRLAMRRPCPNGLTKEGKPRKNKNRNGLNKDHAAYMRVWRKENK